MFINTWQNYKITTICTSTENYSYTEKFLYMEIKQLLTNFVPKIKLMAYEKKIPVDMDCPLRLTMSLIESKWKSCILDELRNGTSMRPS